MPSLGPQVAEGAVAQATVMPGRGGGGREGEEEGMRLVCGEAGTLAGSERWMDPCGQWRVQGGVCGGVRAGVRAEGRAEGRLGVQKGAGSGRL